MKTPANEVKPEWSLNTIGDIIEDMTNAEFSSDGDIVCSPPREFPSSMEHWGRRRDLILQAPDLLLRNQQLEEENKRLKEVITTIESDTQIGELLDTIAAKDRELSELRTSFGFTKLQEHKKEILELRASNKALREALQGSIKIIRSLIASERIVNLDEALAYYEAALSSSETKPE